MADERMNIPLDEGDDKELDRILDEVSRLVVPATVSPNEAWGRFLSTVEEEKVRVDTPIRTVVWGRVILQWAAAIALLVSTGFAAYFYLNTVTVSTSQGDSTTHLFPGGSSVVLNAESVIKYKKWGSRRVVSLAGEGYFEVVKGETFSVTTTRGRVDVLGTGFNVYARDEVFRIQVSHGEVEVKPRSGSSAKLSKGMAFYSQPGDDQASIMDIDISRVNSWTKGEFYFEAEDLPVVFGEIERQFGVVIHHEGVKGRKYTGFFDKDDLGEALENVCYPMGLQFEIKAQNTIMVW